MSNRKPSEKPSEAQSRVLRNMVDRGGETIIFSHYAVQTSLARYRDRIGVPDTTKMALLDRGWIERADVSGGMNFRITEAGRKAIGAHP